jgi:hypothetical protein
LATLSGSTTGLDILVLSCNTVSDSQIDISKTIFVIIDGASSMTEKEAGFVTLFTIDVGHSIAPFCCISIKKHCTLNMI